MPNGDPQDGFFYPTLTLIIDSYNLSDEVEVISDDEILNSSKDADDSSQDMKTTEDSLNDTALEADASLDHLDQSDAVILDDSVDVSVNLKENAKETEAAVDSLLLEDENDSNSADKGETVSNKTEESSKKEETSKTDEDESTSQKNEESTEKEEKSDADAKSSENDGDPGGDDKEGAGGGD